MTAVTIAPPQTREQKVQAERAECARLGIRAAGWAQGRGQMTDAERRDAHEYAIEDMGADS